LLSDVLSIATVHFEQYNRKVAIALPNRCYRSGLVCRHIRLWHLQDMATGPDDVRFQRKTGSRRGPVKPTRMTRFEVGVVRTLSS